jgi:hypothetical protein
MGRRVIRQDHAESPGAGSAKLRLSRGFPRCLAHGEKRIGVSAWGGSGCGRWVTSQGRITRKAPVRTEPHPTNLRCLAYDVLVDQLTKEFMGVALQGRFTRNARVRAEPHPTDPRCLAYDVTLYKLTDQLTKEFIGVASQGRFTRKAPVRAEPHPTNLRCLAYDVIRYALRLVLVIDVEDHGG